MPRHSRGPCLQRLPDPGRRPVGRDLCRVVGSRRDRYCGGPALPTAQAAAQLRARRQSRSPRRQRRSLMSRGTRLVVLASLGLGVFLVGVELMVTAVALPQILESLSDWTHLPHASWIVNGYLVAYVAVMPLAGRAADRYNMATLYGLSLGAFAVGSFVAGTAQSLDWLIAARVVQGAGAGAVFPLAIAAAGHLFEGPARARAIGLVG